MHICRYGVAMDGVAIRVERLGKQYRIGSRQAPYTTLRESISNAFVAPFRKRPLGDRRGSNGERGDTIWALQDVSFEVRQGEVIGVIGRNGAGKSTLLKILSRITEPTTGQVTIYGRVGSLLEVGTGFHSELTGRENIYLSGAILGMGRAEIRRKFDEIVAFSEVERFVDTPVKHYSSGMYLRLAFAVAAHLEPEILLVDEVLAVGDASFQKKCLGKMGDVAKQGRTVLFVSHNMGAISSICEKGIVLDAGRILFAGSITDAVSLYLDQFAPSQLNEMSISRRQDRTGTGEIRLTHFYLESERGERLEAARNGETANLVFRYVTRAADGARNVDFHIALYTESGELLVQLGTRFTGQRLPWIPSVGALVCEIRRLPLVPGRYRLDAHVATEGVAADYLVWLASVSVVDGDFYGSGYRVFEKESRFLVDGRVLCRVGADGEGRGP